MSILKVALLVGLALVNLDFNIASENEQTHQCKSCEWISEDGAKALFAIRNYLESGHNEKTSTLAQLEIALAAVKAGELPAEFSDVRDKRALEDILSNIIVMSEVGCDADVAKMLITFEARLLEGETWLGASRKNNQVSELTRFLEREHIRILNDCKYKAELQVPTLKVDAYVQVSRLTFVEFSEFLNDEFSKLRSKSGPLSLWFTGLGSLFAPSTDTSRLSTFDQGTALMKSTKKIIERDYLFEKIQNRASVFFGGLSIKEGASVEQCKLAVKKNLVTKHEKASRTLQQELEGLTILANYSPVDFAPKQKRNLKEDRDILLITDNYRNKFLAQNKDLADLIVLNSLIRKTINRADKMCEAPAEYSD